MALFADGATQYLYVYVLGYSESDGNSIMPLDIALPFYGDVAYMKKTVASVLAQTDPDWRLIVVDDGYPDDSLPDWFASLNDSRISYQRNEINLGANGNCRKCLGLVSDEFCVVMGADDILEPDYVQQIHRAIRSHPDAAMIHPRVKVIDENDNEVMTRADRIKNKVHGSSATDVELSGELLAASLMRGNWMYFPSIAWRTREIKAIGFREGFNVCQDLGLAMDVIMRGGVMVQIPESIFRYRRHLTSDSSAKALDGSRFIEERNFFSVMELELRNLGWKKASRAARIHWTSRLHALSLLPKVRKSLSNLGTLAKHGLSI